MSEGLFQLRGNFVISHFSYFKFLVTSGSFYISTCRFSFLCEFFIHFRRVHWLMRLNWRFNADLFKASLLSLFAWRHGKSFKNKKTTWSSNSEGAVFICAHTQSTKRGNVNGAEPHGRAKHSGRRHVITLRDECTLAKEQQINPRTTVKCPVKMLEKSVRCVSISTVKQESCIDVTWKLITKKKLKLIILCNKIKKNCVPIHLAKVDVSLEV